MKRKLEVSELIFKVISYLLLTVFALCCLYPFLYAVSASISGRAYVENGLIETEVTRAQTDESGNPIDVTEQDIQDFCLDLPRYKRPRQIIFAPVPRNATGKIEKPALRAKYGAENLVDRENQG